MTSHKKDYACPPGAFGAPLRSLANPDAILTAEASALSANLEKGSLLAVEDMNRAGSAGGLAIEIVFRNTFSDAERTDEQARALVERGAVVVTGAWNNLIQIDPRPSRW